jgi:zinc transport system permease protein
MMGPLYEWCRRQAEAGHLPGSFKYEFMVRGMLAALLVSPLLGGLSHIVVTKRLAFFSAALGNAALTGLSIGIVLGEPPTSAYGGLYGFSLLLAIVMVYVRRRSRLSPDTLVGVFLALTLGLGICLLVAVTKQFNIHQIQSIMFGDILTVTERDLGVLFVVAAGVALLVARYYNEILLSAMDSSLAEASGARVALMEYLFVILLTLAIVASLKIIGALLVGALVVVPAASAKNLAGSLRGYFGWSVAIATLGSLFGLLLSDRFPVPSGGAIVLALAGLFFVTLGAGVLWRRST